MLEPFGSQIMRILNVLTPSEIDRYTDTAYQQQLRSSVATGEEELSLENQSAQPHLEDLARQDAGESTEEGAEEEEGKAKIIPLHAEQADLAPESEEEVEQVVEVSAPTTTTTQMRPQSQTAPKSELESIGVMSAQTIRELQEEEVRKKKAKRDSSSVFIMKEKKKLALSQNKLREQSAISNYQKLGSVELIKAIEEEEEGEEETKVGLSSGILIDKEQY
jgi:hypothetical protein